MLHVIPKGHWPGHMCTSTRHFGKQKPQQHVDQTQSSHPNGMQSGNSCLRMTPPDTGSCLCRTLKFTEPHCCVTMTNDV
jgi:hypothetical protein